MKYFKILLKMTTKSQNKENNSSSKERKTYPGEQTAEEIMKDLRESQLETQDLDPEELDRYFLRKYGIPLEYNQ